MSIRLVHAGRDCVENDLLSCPAASGRPEIRYIESACGIVFGTSGSSHLFVELADTKHGIVVEFGDLYSSLPGKL